MILESSSLQHRATLKEASVAITVDMAPSLGEDRPADEMLSWQACKSAELARSTRKTRATSADIARQVGVSRKTVYHYLGMDGPQEHKRPIRNPNVRVLAPYDSCLFATGLLADEAAVRAGLTMVWSNGQTVGHVDRLTLIKRTMYGRANFDLLRQRVLRAHNQISPSSTNIGTRPQFINFAGDP